MKLEQRKQAKNPMDYTAAYVIVNAGKVQEIFMENFREGGVFWRVGTREPLQVALESLVHSGFTKLYLEVTEAATKESLDDLNLVLQYKKESEREHLKEEILAVRKKLATLEEELENL